MVQLLGEPPAPVNPGRCGMGTRSQCVATTLPEATQLGETRKSYDQIASWWLEQMRGSTYGSAALERALRFLGNGRLALDVGAAAKAGGKRFECSSLGVQSMAPRLSDCTGILSAISNHSFCRVKSPRTHPLARAFQVVSWSWYFSLRLLARRPDRLPVIRNAGNSRDAAYRSH